MFTQEFQRQIKKLNKDIYVDFKNTHFNTNPEQGTCGVYALGRNDAADISEFGSDGLDRKHLDHLRSRGMGYICYTAAYYIPMVNQYNEKGMIVAPGLREILNRLMSKGLIQKEETEILFQVGMLGEYDWDKMTHERKIQWIQCSDLQEMKSLKRSWTQPEGQGIQL